ncbi:hypothetical protein HPB47_023937 [Ixodes persulcatus]|uniref:Uncharacterized protein n=1 Tax=Ixodes persulcatus TaxID=34615 RepID=A0AC60Q664_IXOPE|nr:hypothetical protein HPB47_023937 [Ixodes persulcatus]
MSRTSSHRQKILKEIGSPTRATKEDILLYAEHLGIDLPNEQNLLWIAQAGLEVSLPPPWYPVEDSQGRIYYYNSVTKETKWEHPLDSYYKAMVKKERIKAGLQNSAASDANLEDSGASLMSSLDDIPPLSTFARASDSEQTVVHISLLKKEKKNTFLSKSCPTNLNILTVKTAPPLPTKQADSDSESHTATLKNDKKEGERVLPDLKDLLSQKQALVAELEQLKREVHKYRRLREQLRASAKQELVQLGASTATKERSMCTDVARRPQKCSPPRQKIVARESEAPNAGEKAKRPQTTAALVPAVQPSLGHSDLLRLSQRLAHLRHRHLQLSLRAAQQVAEDALARIVQSTHESKRRSRHQSRVSVRHIATTAVCRLAPESTEPGGRPARSVVSSRVDCQVVSAALESRRVRTAPAAHQIAAAKSLAIPPVNKLFAQLIECCQTVQ